IGLAVFGSESFLQCPLTHDHGVLLDFLNRVNFHPEISRSTAIGMSLATAINALRKSQAKSKIIVLLTDGVNNAGEIHPLTAADLAASLDIKIYSIGIGKPGESEVLVTVDDPYFGRRKVPMRIEMDENILQAVSDAASGLYFNAQNTGMLEKIYNEINTLEKSKITTRQYLEYNEQFTFFLLAAAIFLLLEIILNHTRFRKLP
ncbi:MAG TPA: aerotolerance regulator BatA, partial [Spirochaetia bacterium]|nr:aerotolerance regulator BatA [Spirochaetia bacterium]